MFDQKLVSNFWGWPFKGWAKKSIFANTEFHVGSLGHLKGENKVKEGGLEVPAALSKIVLYYFPVNSDLRRLSCLAIMVLS